MSNSIKNIKLAGLRIYSLMIFCLALCTLSSQFAYGQDVKKNRVRLKADYVKIMGDESYFDIKASAKIQKKNVPVSNIDVIIFHELDDDQIELGTVTTDNNGEHRFIIKDFNKLKTDSTNIYNFLISFKGNDDFKKAKKSIQFKDAIITAEIITKDSINYLSATLMEESTDSVLVDQSLQVQVQRLFKPLRIGEEFNNTDDNGTIFVPIERGIPGVDGNLIIEAVLNDSDEYGTVKAFVKAPIGVPIIDESTFDQRTMWSPRNKTPIFMLVFTNLLIVGIWGIIIYLISNLFKIVKLKS